MPQPLLWMMVIAGVLISTGLFVFAFQGDRSRNEPFRWRHMVLDARSIDESSRMQLLLEGGLGLLVTAGVVYAWLL